MNLAKIYAEAAGKKPTEETQKRLATEKVASQEEQANRIASVSQWQQHPHTKQFLNELKQQVIELDNMARAMAMSSTVNHQQIQNCLVQSETIRKVIEASHE